jgi:hypothetical protein
MDACGEIAGAHHVPKFYHRLEHACLRRVDEIVSAADIEDTCRCRGLDALLSQQNPDIHHKIV